jgi:hypothetical protein
MHDLSIAMAFMAIVLSPCFVAVSTGIHKGAESGILDTAELEDLESRYSHVPGHQGS